MYILGRYYYKYYTLRYYTYFLSLIKTYLLSSHVYLAIIKLFDLCYHNSLRIEVGINYRYHMIPYDLYLI